MSKLYKVLVDGKSCHGGDFAWNLPTDGPGAWHRVDSPPVLFHLTEDPASWYKAGCRIYEAEGKTPRDIGTSPHKQVFGEARLLREVTDPGELAGLRIFVSGHHRIDAGQSVAYGSAHVEAYGSAHVEASGSARVEASGSAHVEAYGSASVRAYGSAHVEASGSARVEASGSVTVVVFWGDLNVSAEGNAIVIDRRGDKPVIYGAVRP